MMLPDNWHIFVWGVFGSIAVEVAQIIKRYETPGRFPARYSRRMYWFLRVLLAMVSGGFSFAYGVTSPIVAIHIGVATPLILATFAKTEPKTPNSGIE